MKNRNNHLIYFICIFSFLLMPVTPLLANSYSGKEMNVVYIVGVVLMVIRIVVPILLIVTAMITLVKAMLDSNDKDIKREIISLLPKLVSAIIIFLLPLFLALILKLISQDSLWNEYATCLSKPSSCKVELWKYPESSTPSIPTESNNIPDDTGIPSNPNAAAVVEEALKYKGKDTKTDCSGFVKKILKKYGYLDSEMASVSARCEGANRGSNGMYLLYKKRGRIVWERDSSARTTSDALKTFPGGCQPGDVVFYTYGSGAKINDCVKHVVIYTGMKNGKPMIIDSNTEDHVARYRSADAIFWAAIPIACARP